MEKDAETGTGTVDIKEMAKDDEILSAPEPRKPEEPRDFDRDLAKEKVMKAFNIWKIFDSHLVVHRLKKTLDYAEDLREKANSSWNSKWAASPLEVRETLKITKRRPGEMPPGRPKFLSKFSLTERKLVIRPVSI